MKKLARIFFIELLAVYLTTQLASGLTFSDQLQGVLITSAALAAANYLVKPIISILILPLTLATLGLFRFITHGITLYVVDTALTDFSVSTFHFAGLHSPYLDLPQITFYGPVMNYLAFSLIISFIVSFIHWLRK